MPAGRRRAIRAADFAAAGAPYRLDNDADGDIDDSGTDYVYASYDFNDPGGGDTWQKMTLTHDHNGNLTGDGLFLYTYDAWNRLVGVWYAAGDTSVAGERVARYEYDALFRRVEKEVSNRGIGVVDGSDAGGITGVLAGNLFERYYYAGWRLVEVRNNASPNNQTLSQFVYGTQYIDEPIAYDRNTDVSSDNDCLDAGSKRYTYHQDANYRVVMLTDENAAVVERYEYSAYGEPTILLGGTSSEAGNTLYVSSVGNPLMHQGLWRDGETGSYQNRFRQLHSKTGRWMQPDPIGYADGLNLLEYLESSSASGVDPEGLDDEDEAELDRALRGGVRRGLDRGKSPSNKGLRSAEEQAERERWIREQEQDLARGLIKTGWVLLDTADKISDLAGLAGIAKGLAKAGVKVLLKNGVKKFISKEGKEITEAEAKKLAKEAIKEGTESASKKSTKEGAKKAAKEGEEQAAKKGTKNSAKKGEEGKATGGKPKRSDEECWNLYYWCIAYGACRGDHNHNCADGLAQCRRTGVWDDSSWPTGPDADAGSRPEGYE